MHGRWGGRAPLPPEDGHTCGGFGAQRGDPSTKCQRQGQLERRLILRSRSPAHCTRLHARGTGESAWVGGGKHPPGHGRFRKVPGVIIQMQSSQPQALSRHPQRAHHLPDVRCLSAEQRNRVLTPSPGEMRLVRARGMHGKPHAARRPRGGREKKPFSCASRAAQKLEEENLTWAIAAAETRGPARGPSRGVHITH